MGRSLGTPENERAAHERPVKGLGIRSESERFHVGAKQKEVPFRKIWSVANYECRE